SPAGSRRTRASRWHDARATRRTRGSLPRRLPAAPRRSRAEARASRTFIPPGLVLRRGKFATGGARGERRGGRREKGEDVRRLRDRIELPSPLAGKKHGRIKKTRISPALDPGHACRRGRKKIFYLLPSFFFFMPASTTPWCVPLPQACAAAAGCRVHRERSHRRR